MRITAILDAGLLSGKVKLSERKREIRMFLPLPVKNIFIEETIVSPDLKTTPVMVFEWYKQIKKYTHVYRLKEIE